jgi:spermidine/putrescine transport system substrate-binding protein
MRKFTILLSLFALATILGTGFVSAQGESEWVCPEEVKGGTLRVFNWTTYVAEDTIPNFEEACDATVEYFEYGSNEEMVAIVRSESAQYDIVVPTGSTVAEMVTEGLLMKLDHSKISNMANVMEQFIDPPYDPGNEYSLPYQWGTIGIGFDTTVIDPEDMTSWADFFGYDGRVAWLDDTDSVIGVGLLLQGLDPNSQDEAEVLGAAQYLLDINKADVFDILPDTGQDFLVRGEIDATIEYSGDIFQIIDECECEDFAYVIPEEGTNVWTDNMAIPFNAPNPDLAHAFIDYILDAHVGADLSNYTAYGTPNRAALEFIDPELLENPGIYPSDETLGRLFFAEGKLGDVAQYYSEAWNLLNSQIGSSGEG